MSITTTTRPTTDEQTTETDIEDLRIESDPRLRPFEKEVHFTITGNDDYIDVFSERASVTRNLLSHDEFVGEKVRVALDDDTVTTVPVDEVPSNATTIYAVHGTVPIGVLKVMKESRQNNNSSNIVSSE